MGFNYLDSHKSGTSQPYITLGTLREFPILVPKIFEEQKAIISVLSSLDDKIDLLHRQNTTLEAMAETLFRQWFVEPIKKVEEGLNVEGFKNGKFSLWIRDTIGGEWGKENLEGEYTKLVNCIGGTDVADLNVGLPNRTPLRFVKEKKFENIEPQEGDLILEISGGTESQSTGRTTYINGDVKTLFAYALVFFKFLSFVTH
jgi:type I restriction enzyme S subunit